MDKALTFPHFFKLSGLPRKSRSERGPGERRTTELESGGVVGEYRMIASLDSCLQAASLTLAQKRD